MFASPRILEIPDSLEYMNVQSASINKSQIVMQATQHKTNYQYFYPLTVRSISESKNLRPPKSFACVQKPTQRKLIIALFSLEQHNAQ